MKQPKSNNTISQDVNNCTKALALLYEQRIAENPQAQAIANHLNTKRASRKALIAMRATEDSLHNKLRIQRLSKMLKDELGYCGDIERASLLPIIGYLVFHEEPWNIHTIPIKQK
jgi:hypothetical protein